MHGPEMIDPPRVKTAKIPKQSDDKMAMPSSTSVAAACTDLHLCQSSVARQLLHDTIVFISPKDIKSFVPETITANFLAMFLTKLTPTAGMADQGSGYITDQEVLTTAAELCQPTEYTLANRSALEQRIIVALGQRKYNTGIAPQAKTNAAGSGDIAPASNTDIDGSNTAGGTHDETTASEVSTSRSDPARAQDPPSLETEKPEKDEGALLPDSTGKAKNPEKPEQPRHTKKDKREGTQAVDDKPKKTSSPLCPRPSLPTFLPCS